MYTLLSTVDTIVVNTVVITDVVDVVCLIERPQRTR